MIYKTLTKQAYHQCLPIVYVSLLEGLVQVEDVAVSAAHHIVL